MTISIYLIRLLVAFVFGASVLVNALGIYCGISEDWNSIGQFQTIMAHIFAFAVLLGSAYLLWVIK